MKTWKLRHLVVIGALLGGTSVTAPAQGHRSHPPMPNQRFYVQCRLEGGGKPTLLEVPLEIPSPTAPAEIDQVIELPAPLAALRLTRYLPRAELEQSMVSNGSLGAAPAILLSVEGPTQSHQLWLVADDPQRNRLISLIGTWRYMSAADEKQRDELFRQFKTELTRAPTLHVSRADGSSPCELAARPGTAHGLDDLGCQVRVRAFYPHFSFDKETHKPVNRSDKRLNPAALVEIEHNGKKEERWVFAKFPDFKGKEAQALPFRVTLDCPLARKRTTPDFVLVTIDRRAHEVWTRHDGNITARPARVGERIDAPGSRYDFHIVRFVESGRLVEECRPSDTRGAITALQAATTDASGRPLVVWLELGKQRVIATDKGRLVVSFGPRQTVPAAGRHEKTAP